MDVTLILHRVSFVQVDEKNTKLRQNHAVSRPDLDLAEMSCDFCHLVSDNMRPGQSCLIWSICLLTQIVT